MEALKEYPHIKYPPDTLYQVRKLYNLEQPGRMKEAVDILEEWIKKQQHFESKNFDRDYLEMQLINCKGSIEKAKVKLERLCTLRTFAPEFFEAELMEVKLNRTVCLYAGMPMLTPDFNRIFVVKLVTDLIPEDFLNIYRDYILSNEYILRKGYCAGNIAIIDLRDTNMANVLSNFNFTITNKYFTIIQEGYGLRIAALHFLSDSKLIENFLSIVKPMIPGKLASRIHVHTSLETLHKMVPKELLPKDLGGNEPPLAELHAIRINDYINTKEHIEYMKEVVLKQKTDESKRIGGKVDLDFLPGTFRSLNVD